MTQIVRIVAAIVDTSYLTMYKQDGSTITIPQGDARVRRIVTEAPSQIARQGYADIDLYMENSYQQFEEETKGSFKLFKIARDKLKGFFGKKEPVISEAVIGTVPPAPYRKPMSMAAAIEDILQHAVPVSSGSFTEDNLSEQRNIVESDGQTPNDKEDKDTSTHTVIAVTPDNTIVPGVEKIKTQFTRAVKLGSTKGVEAFLTRAGKVAAERQHSVEDLLKFMERGDLPIADDGSILIYKVLSKKNGKFVDCHTKKVEQWVGAYVHMDTSLVDHNRNNECSNGLHVARRGYISQFSGDVCTLCKVAPEDVIAVPSYDANKMRVCGYHIIAELTKAQYERIKGNQGLTDQDGGTTLLANAIAGQHIGITHKVKIGGQMGSNVTSEATATPTPTAKPKAEPVVPVQALENPAKEQSDTPVALKEVVKATKEAAKQAPKAFQPPAKAFVSTPVEGSPRDRIQKLLAIGLSSKGVAENILKVKKEAKKGWGALGVSDGQVAKILKSAGK